MRWVRVQMLPRALQAEHEGDERLQIRTVGRNAGHAGRTSMIAGLLQEPRNFFRVQPRAGEVRSIVRAFSMGAVTFIALIGPPASLAPRDERSLAGSRARHLRSRRGCGSWRRRRRGRHAHRCSRCFAAGAVVRSRAGRERQGQQHWHHPPWRSRHLQLPPFLHHSKRRYSAFKCRD